MPTPLLGNCDSTGTTHCYAVVALGVGNPCGTGMLPACFTGGTSAGSSLIPVTVGGNTYISAETPGSQAIFNSPRSQVESLKIDLASVQYAAGIVDITGQEKTHAWDIQIADEVDGGRGINVARVGCQGNGGSCGTQSPGDPNEVQNSGPWCGGPGCEINWAATGCTSTNFPDPTYGIFVQNQPSVTVGSGGHITLNGTLPTGDSCTAPTSNLTAIDVSGSGVIVENIHTEKWYDAVRAGTNTDTLGAHIANITDVANVTNAVEIASDSHTTTGIVSSVESMGTNAILDNQSSGFASTSSSLSTYVIGPSGRVNNFVARGNSLIDSISTYNNVTTAGLGVPAVYGVSNVTGQGGALPVTDIIALTASAGEYTIHYYIDQSAACTLAVASVTFTFGWTDASASRTATPAALTLGVTLGNNIIQGAIPIYSASGKPIAYSSTTSGCTGGKYDVHISAEQSQ